MTGVYSHVKYMLHIDERHFDSRPLFESVIAAQTCGRARAGAAAAYAPSTRRRGGK